MLVMEAVAKHSLPDSCNSPARKRQRLSSPTYDGDFEELSHDDLIALDRIEARLSQADQSPTKSSQSTKSTSKPVADILPACDKENISFYPLARGQSKSFTKNAGSQQSKFSELRDDPDNPFIDQLPSFTSAKLIEYSLRLECRAVLRIHLRFQILRSL